MERCLTVDEILNLINNGDDSDFEDDNDGDSYFYGVVDESIQEAASAAQEAASAAHEPAQEEIAGNGEPEQMEIAIALEEEVVSNVRGTNRRVASRKEKWVNTMPYRKNIRFKRKVRKIRDDPIPKTNYYNENNRKDWNELKYFQQYFPDQFIERLVYFTNLKSAQDLGRSINTSDTEIKKWIGLTIYMSTLGYPRILMY